MNKNRLTNYEINILQEALNVLADSITEWDSDAYEYAEELALLSLKLERMKDMYDKNQW